MRNLAVLGLVAMLSLALGVTAFASDGAPWSYEGDTGPEHWCELSDDYATCCEGTEQSPVDILAGTPTNPPDIVFNYEPTALSIANNGHTIVVSYDEGSSMTVEGKTYNLLQFHFHAPSEDTVAGEHYAGQMHLPHVSADGEVAVVGVFLTEGDENAAYAPVWDNLPAEEGELKTIEGVTVNAADLLPADKAYYRYDGSRSEPPCTEGVKWFVMSNPVALSPAQMDAFEAIYDHNIRPVQPFNARVFYVGGQPLTVPETGGAAFSLEAVVIGFGTLTAAAGVYLQRRKAA